LDDSANKRISIPESFLAIDAILILMKNISSGLIVYPEVIQRHLTAELPFMATENILMAAVRRGGDRQVLHEKIRKHSMDAGNRVKLEGAENDLLQRIAADPSFDLAQEELAELLDAGLYIGRAPQQVEEYLEQVVYPLLKANPVQIETEEPLRV
jgi:adenylosuccinate lyase